jgi:hypothetical protein
MAPKTTIVDNKKYNLKGYKDSIVDALKYRATQERKGTEVIIITEHYGLIKKKTRYLLYTRTNLT